MKRRRLHSQPRKKFTWFKSIDIFKYLSIILIIFFIFSTPTFVKKLIKIKTVECQSQYGECPQNIVSDLKYLESSDYLVAKKRINQVLSENSRVSSFLIQYKIPSTIKVDLNLKKPKYSIKNSSNIYFNVDTEGNVLEVSNESLLPVVTKNDLSYKVGDKVSDQEKFALKIFEKVSWILTTSSGEIQEESLKIITNEGKVVYFPLTGDVDVLVGSLRLIFSRLNEGSQGIKMEDIKEIDLRFANPVLR